MIFLKSAMFTISSKINIQLPSPDEQSDVPFCYCVFYGDINDQYFENADRLNLISHYVPHTSLNDSKYATLCPQNNRPAKRIVICMS